MVRGGEEGRSGNTFHELFSEFRLLNVRSVDQPAPPLARGWTDLVHLSVYVIGDVNRETPSRLARVTYPRHDNRLPITVVANATLSEQKARYACRNYESVDPFFRKKKRMFPFVISEYLKLRSPVYDLA